MQNITLSEIASLFIRQLKWLLIGLVVGALLLSMYTVLLVDDRYTSSVSLYVKNTEDTKDGVATTNNLHAARMLTNSYVLILQDPETLQKMAKRMTVSASVLDIYNALKINTAEDTAIINVSATTNDAILSQAICQALCDVAPEMLSSIVGAGAVRTLGTVPAAVKTGPNALKNGLLGGVAGLLLAAAVVFVVYLCDTTVKSKEELQRMTDLPILGEIPSLK